MNINELTIGELKQVAKLASGLGSCNEDSNCNADGRHVIVRSRDQGVMHGNLQNIEGSTVRLNNAVQMWQWKAAKGGTLVDCAVHGVEAEKCKFSTGAASVSIINACAVIDCSNEGANSLQSVAGSDWS